MAADGNPHYHPCLCRCIEWIRLHTNKGNVAEAGNAGSTSPLQVTEAPEGAFLAAIRGIEDPAAGTSPQGM